MPTPTLGLIVLYCNLGDSEGRYPPEDHPALITKTELRADLDHSHSGACIESCFHVSLRIFYETGDFWMVDVPYAEQQKRAHWRWPTRVG